MKHCIAALFAVCIFNSFAASTPVDLTATYTQNYICASPAAANGIPLLRPMVALDLGTVVVPANNGGTGTASPTTHGVLIAHGSSAVTPLVGGAGTVLNGQSGADPIFTSSIQLGSTGVQGSWTTFGSTSGSTQFFPNATGSITLAGPSSSGTLIATGDTGTVTNTMLATISTVGKVSNSATTATNANTNSAIVARDGSGNFSAGTISIIGMAASGSTAIDFSGSTGVFKTSSGLNTLSGATTINDATTPSLTTASGKTNTGFVQINGKTSGGFKILPVDATAQTVTQSIAAQTIGAATVTIPDQAGGTRNFVFDTLAQTLTNKTFTAPVLGTPTSGTLTSCTGLPLTTGVTGTLSVSNGGTGDTGTAWTSFSGTPTSMGAAFTTSSFTGWYKQIGKTYFVNYNITITTKGVGANTNILVALPNSATAAHNGCPCVGRENSVTGKMLQGFTNSTSGLLTLVYYDNSDPGVSGGSYFVSGTFEAQ